MDDLARVSAGVPVAVLLASALPVLRRRPYWKAGLFSAAYAAFTLAPVLPDWQGIFLLLAAFPAGCLCARVASPREPATGVSASTAPKTPPPDRRHGLVWAGIGFAVAAGGLSALLLDAGATWHAVKATVGDDRFAIAASGSLAAVFIGGLVVNLILAPFAEKLTDVDAASLENAGTYIGWCERALFFAFLLGGEPQAAAVALAAKSFARFPSLSKHEEGFAEYFLIGTLASVLVALAAAAATRAALGMTPL